MLGKSIYFDSIDNSAYILGQALHSARTVCRWKSVWFVAEMPRCPAVP
jgi:hypothetical protein